MTPHEPMITIAGLKKGFGEDPGTPVVDPVLTSQTGSNAFAKERP